MGGAATARERQAALRDRRRKNNLNYIHVWANADQERAIKDFLASPVASPLHVTHKSESDEVTKLRSELEHQQWELQQLRQQVSLNEIELEAQRRTEASIEKRELMAEKAMLRYEALAAEYQNWNDEISQRNEEILERERKLNILEREMKAAGARLKRDSDSKKMTDKARTEALIQRFTTERDYSCNAADAYKAIEDDWKIEQRVKEVSKLTARTKTVHTSLVNLVREFKDLLGDKESDNLLDAAEVLHRIGMAASQAQRSARSMEVQLKREEKQRHAVAYEAARMCLQTLSDADKVMVFCILDHYSFELDKFLTAEIPYWTSMSEQLAKVKEGAQDATARKLKDFLKTGQNIEQAMVSFNTFIAEHAPKANEVFGRKIEAAIAAVVAEQLVRANSA